MFTIVTCCKRLHRSIVGVVAWVLSATADAAVNVTSANPLASILPTHVGVSTFAVMLGSVCVLVPALSLGLFLGFQHDRERHGLRSSLADARTRLGMLAAIDSLTALPNREAMFRSINAQITESRATGSRFHLMHVNLDAFKAFNESYGSAVGDGLLRALGSHLVRVAGSDGVVGRIGGDEFAVIVVRVGEEGVFELATRLLSTMRAGVMVKGGASLRASLSIGIVACPKDGGDAEALLKNADRAVATVKASGGNGCRLYEPDMDESFARMLQIQGALPGALDAGDFQLHFQPKFDRDGVTIAGAEALIRWVHPQLGEVPPSEFIALAERSDLIVRIGDWVIERTCQHLKAWQGSGLRPIRVAVNLSPRQLRQPGFVRAVTRMVEHHGVDPACLMFEITETVAMEFAEQTAANIREFQEAGFDMSIDDFGTGYSSLAYLQRFRARQLKIDRFFVGALDDQGDEGYAIVSAIISLAHTLRMEVVAEGVETQSQLSALAELRCDQVQGFLLGKPMSAPEFESFVRRQASSVMPA
jgi:diguanylate cyclase (GGDEF)-like protein